MASAVLRGLIATIEALAALVLLAMMLLTFVDVVGRYVVGSPVFGATEMIGAMLALVIFLGLAVANARDRHIVVELFDGPLRRAAPRAYDIVVQGFSLVAMGLIALVLVEQAIEAASVGSRTVVLEWPLAWIAGAVGILAVLGMVCQILGLVTGESSRREADEGIAP